MQRRSLLLFGALCPLGLLTARYMRARTPRSSAAPDYRAQAERLNVLAGSIHSKHDARQLVDLVAEISSDSLPPAWTMGSLLDQTAQTEFATVSDPSKLIREPRVAEAWNTYVRTIHAPDEACATPAEIHNLRDAFFSLSRLSWTGGSRDIWSVPSIYATQSDGQLASGLRAIESLRLLWDLANMPDNHMAARDRVAHGVLVSEQLKEHHARPAITGGVVMMQASVSSNPLEDAARQYVKSNGMSAYSKLVMEMITSTYA